MTNICTKVTVRKRHIKNGLLSLYLNFYPPARNPIFYATSDVFKRAIDAIIAYGTEKYKSIFGNDEAADSRM